MPPPQKSCVKVYCVASLSHTRWRHCRLWICGVETSRLLLQVSTLYHDSSLGNAINIQLVNLMLMDYVEVCTCTCTSSLCHKFVNAAKLHVQCVFVMTSRFGCLVRRCLLQRYDVTMFARKSLRLHTTLTTHYVASASGRSQSMSRTTRNHNIMTSQYCSPGKGPHHDVAILLTR